jgi:hypothetical protein
MATDTFNQALLGVLPQIPYFGVLIAGFVLAILWMPRCPKAATLVLIGVIVLFVRFAASMAFFALAAEPLIDRMGIESWRTISAVVNAILSLVGATGTLLIVLAAFADRPQRFR